MSTMAQTRSSVPVEERGLLAQSMTVVWRNLLHIKRMPEMLLDVTIQPVMFTLLFAFVFGGSIAVSGADYREFLLPGIMAQTIVFSCFVVAVGLTNDLSKGIVDRFKSLPMSRASVLVGRSISSLIHSSIGIFVMALTGLAIGWRMREGFASAALAFGLLLLFGFSMIWVGIWVGSLLQSVEAVRGPCSRSCFRSPSSRTRSRPRRTCRRGYASLRSGTRCRRSHRRAAIFGVTATRHCPPPHSPCSTRRFRPWCGRL
jgi:hypothetical protein